MAPIVLIVKIGERERRGWGGLLVKWRRAFEPKTGRRHIRTCYGEREELLSSIRMIERARTA